MKYITINPHLILEPGEKMCTECNGWGYLKSEQESNELFSSGHIRCHRCLGKCTLEFIDAVVGQNRDKRWV